MAGQKLSIGPQLKYAGYDVLVITGRAAELSYLVINDETVEIRPAAEYQGQGSLTAEKNFKDHLAKVVEEFENRGQTEADG